MANSHLLQLARQLRQLKSRSGRSYDNLAEQLHISRSSVHRYCTGGAAPPDLQLVERFAEICGASREEHAVLNRSWVLATASRSASPLTDGMDAGTPSFRDSQEACAGRRGLRRSNLPYDIGDFTGRRAELVGLLTSLAGGQTDGQGTVIHALDGMAGIGKSALAIRVAHLLAAQYPDAQLFVDLHGHTAGRSPVTPADALHKLLHAWGVPDDEIPNDLDERASVWRASLVGERALIVLDDAVDAAQVRPLLPGSDGCLMLLTSRRRMTDLQAAACTTLDPLRAQEALDLFLRITGSDRNTSRLEAARTAQLCGRLPLAIRIAAARLRGRPAWTARHLNERLSQAGRRLAELSVGDQSLSAAFSQSYRTLSDMQGRVFRLLSLHPAPTIDPGLVAGLLDIDAREAERLLEDLVDLHLLQQVRPSGYQYHELVREYASGLARNDESAEELRIMPERAVGSLFRQLFACL